MRLVRVVFVGAVALLGVTCTALSGSSSEDAGSGDVSKGDLVRGSFSLQMVSCCMLHAAVPRFVFAALDVRKNI